jgi:hypothetical protein
MWNAVGDEEKTDDKVVKMLMSRIRPAFAMESEMEDQARLRSQFPALQAAWERYEMILALVRSNNPEIDSETNEGR